MVRLSGSATRGNKDDVQKSAESAGADWAVVHKAVDACIFEPAGSDPGKDLTACGHGDVKAETICGAET